MYNRLVTKHYRDDNIPLRKRPDRSNSAKECHMKLKLRDQYVMNAVYASCLPDEDVRVAFACYVCVCVCVYVCVCVCA